MAQLPHGRPRPAASSHPLHRTLSSRAARALCASLLLAGAGAAILPVWAQSPTAAAARRSYNIPAGPLGPALSGFAGAAGISLSFEPALTEGRRTAGLQGSLTLEEGFARLLAGSGLEAVARSSGGGYMLRRAAASPTPAVAPPAASRSETQLPTVRVTAERESAWGPTGGYRATRSASATKMDVPVLETPQQVSTIGEQQIRDQAISSVAEAVRYTAGVRPYDYGITDDDIAVRGFYLTGTGLYRDGMRLIQNGFMTNLEPYGLERLEVVHGPASVLYGQSAPGGLVNAVTKRPRAGMQKEVGVEFGTHSRRQVTADVGGALNEQGTLLGRVTLLKRESGTQWHELRADRTYIAPALTLQGERTTLTLMAQYQRDETGFVIPYYRDTPFGPSAADINVNGPGSSHRKRSHSLGYLLEHQVNDRLTLRHNLRYLDGNNDRQEMRNRGLLADQRSMARLAMVRPDAEKTLVVDTHLESRFTTGAASHQLLAGLDYYRSELDWRIYSLNGAVAALDIVAPVYRQPNWSDNFLSDRALAKNSQVGVYLQDQIKFGERWVLSLGGRYDSAKIDTHYDLRGTATAPFTTESVDRRDTAFTGRAGVIYLAPNGLAPYVSVNTSFQPPLATVTAKDAYGQPFQPEKAKQFEVGVRYAPPEAGYTLSAALFDLRKRNVRTPLPSNDRLEVQTGEVRSRGLELQGTGELGGGFSAIGAYTYLDAQITRSNRAFEIGEPLGNMPRHMASLWGKYQRGPMEFGLGVRHISEAAGEIRVAAGGAVPANDGYTLLDAMAAYDTGSWRFSVNVSNLTDKQYKTQCNTFRGGATFCALGYGREVRMGATYKF